MKKLTILFLLVCFPLAAQSDGRFFAAPAAAPAGHDIEDDFSSDTSANYTAIAGSITISSGKAHGGTAWTESILYHETSLGSANQDVSADVSVVSNDTGRVVVRLATGGGGTFYAAGFNASHIKLLRYAGTTPTLIDQHIDTYADGTYTVRLTANGTAIKVYVDGVEKISVTDSTYSAGNYSGFMIGRGAGNADITVDNFTADAL